MQHRSAVSKFIVKCILDKKESGGERGQQGWRNEKRKPLLQGEMFQFNHAENCIFLPLKLKLKYPLVVLLLYLILL